VGIVSRLTYLWSDEVYSLFSLSEDMQLLLGYSGEYLDIVRFISTYALFKPIARAARTV
jgi:hypothetical protein